MRVRKEDIVKSLEQIGVRSGESLMMHSSLSSMGYVEGGADAVADALLEVLGSEGTLMVPTFTHSGTEYFDPLISPSKNGAITEAVRKRPKAIRSLHPTHAPTAFGKYATEFMKDHLERGPLGIDSPVDRIAKKDGWILLLGVDHTTNSTVHVGEAYVSSPSLTVIYSSASPKRVILKLPEDGEIEVVITEMPGCSRGFGAIEEPLRERGQIIDGKIGLAACQLVKGQHVIDVTADLLREKPDVLLCSDPNCRTCVPTRKVLYSLR